MLRADMAEGPRHTCAHLPFSNWVQKLLPQVMTLTQQIADVEPMLVLLLTRRQRRWPNI